MEEEKDEDSIVVADVLDLEEEEVISSLISSLFPSTSLESVMDVDTSDLTSLLEEVVPESSSKNSEIISATAEDFSVLVSGTSPLVAANDDRPSVDSPSSLEIFRSEIEVVAICCAEENSDFAEDFCSENVSVEDLFVNVSDASWDCWTDAASTVSMTEVFLVTTSLVDSE